MCVCVERETDREIDRDKDRETEKEAETDLFKANGLTYTMQKMIITLQWGTYIFIFIE